MSKNKKPYWFPELCDAAYCKRLREDYPDDAADMSDEELIEHYNAGAKYSTTWDDIGDAYEEYEPLADAFLDLLEALKEAESRLSHATFIKSDSHALAETIAKAERAIVKAEGKS